MLEREMWDEGVETLREGDVRTYDGRIVDLRAMVSRRWGWGKSASSATTAWLKNRARFTREPVVLQVGAGRWAQQKELLQAMPDLSRALCAGLAGGASREINHASKEVRTLVFSFDKGMTDDGLVKAVLRAVAGRLGVTMEDLRGMSKFESGSEPGLVVVEVRSSEVI